MKIDTSFFKETFTNQLGFVNTNVHKGPAFGVDASIIHVTPEVDMISASDPLSYIPTLGPELSAFLSVHLIANDIITSGVPPQYFQMVLNLPEYMSKSEFNKYWKALHLECQRKGIAITGGHTGWVMDQNSTVSGGGTMFSFAPKGTLLTSDNAKAGDVILMTKYAAIVSTAILGLQFAQTVNEILPSNSGFSCRDLFHQISVLPEGLCIANFRKKHTDAVHAMHDVTEGGILNAVFEFAHASKLSAEIDTRKIPVLDEQWLICEKFNLSPYEIVGAGSLLISVNPNDLEKLRLYLDANNIKATVIGKFNDAKKSTYLDQNGKSVQLKPAVIDPYWNAFGNALKKGWK